MEIDYAQLSALFPELSGQMRCALSNLYLSASQLASPVQREQDPDLDVRAARLDQSYYQMLRLVNNLAMSEYLLQDQPLNLQNEDLVQLAGGLCERSSDLAELLGIDLRFVCAMDRRICAVHARSIEQLLYHLLSNALKNTPQGGTVTVELRHSGSRIQLSVTDTGCGMSEERKKHLFSLGGSSRDLPNPNATGVGLVLCRRIAECHGGTLLADFPKSGGCRFTLDLPDRQLTGQLSDIPYVYEGGFNPTLLGLADVLPVSAFLIRNRD